MTNHEILQINTSKIGFDKNVELSGSVRTFIEFGVGFPQTQTQHFKLYTSNLQRLDDSLHLPDNFMFYIYNIPPAYTNPQTFIVPMLLRTLIRILPFSQNSS